MRKDAVNLCSNKAFLNHQSIVIEDSVRVLDAH
jgi:hypothetical protein